MSRPRCIHDAWKLLVARFLRDLRQREDDAYTGVVINAGLAAATEHLVRHQGPEAAFNTLTRHADAALAPALAARLRTTDGDR